jgi:hypothetical protein
MPNVCTNCTIEKTACTIRSLTPRNSLHHSIAIPSMTHLLSKRPPVHPYGYIFNLISVYTQSSLLNTARAIEENALHPSLRPFQQNNGLHSNLKTPRIVRCGYGVALSSRDASFRRPFFRLTDGKDVLKYRVGERRSEVDFKEK